MPLEDSPLRDRIMSDTAGRFKSEFIELMHDTLVDSPENHRSVVVSLRHVLDTFSEAYSKNRSDIQRGMQDMQDIAEEMDRLAVLMRAPAVNDAELYDCHVAMLKLISLIKLTLNFVSSETALSCQIAQGKLKASRYIY